MRMNKTIFIVGASGLLGRNFVNQYLQKKWRVIGCYQHHPLELGSPLFVPLKLDILRDDLIKETLAFYKPEVIIHCAGLTNVDMCETQEKLAYKLNGDSVRHFSHYSKRNYAQFVYVSTDHLFSGDRPFYTEEDVGCPLNIYGKSKLYGENISLEENSNSLILRTNFFGKGISWRHSFTDWIWCNLKENKTLNVFEDSFFSPIAIPHLVDIAEKLIEKQALGIFNTCGSERLSKYDFALRFSKFFGLSGNLISPSLTKSANLIANRPSDMSLNTQKLSRFLGNAAPDIQQSLESISKDYKSDE